MSKGSWRRPHDRKKWDNAEYWDRLERKKRLEGKKKKDKNGRQ